MSYSEPKDEETRNAPMNLAPVYRAAPRISWTDATGPHQKVLEARSIVGSAVDAAVRIEDATVSRLHAELDPRHDGLWIRDLGSKNGSFIDGIRVMNARVPDNGKVRLGSTEVLVELDSTRRAVDVWPHDHFGKLVGASAKMREVFASLARIAPMASSVLIRGETGTGKELVARAIHDASPRASKPFVVVDCAALPENLLDAELFGHVKGAFTGAVNTRRGAIEAADHGTVFLDEIGELPISMQPKLLRVLESRTVRRVGESDHRPVDVRFISATHRDLLTMVNAGEFREDLYFRLAVLPAEIPPLRDRKEDIERLVRHFLGDEAGQVSSDLMRALVDRPWRGNVRELRNFVERARALGANEALKLLEEPTKSDPGAAEGPTPAFKPDDPAVFDQAFKEFREAWIDAGEKEYMRRMMAKHARNVAAASRDAEIDRTYIYRLIRKHDL